MAESTWMIFITSSQFLYEPQVKSGKNVRESETAQDSTRSIRDDKEI